MSTRTFFGFNHVHLYRSNHSIQVKGAKWALQKYASAIKCENIRKAIDIGCGPGDITHEHVLPLLSDDCEVLGIDIAQPMVDYAKSAFKNDTRLSFEVMDFEMPSVSKKYPSTFDLAVSFFTFNMLQDQRTAFQNIYNILKNGGKTLIHLVISCPHYTQLEALATNPKWLPYSQDVKAFVSPYHHSADPKNEILDLMQKMGFHVQDCVFTSNIHEFQTEELFWESMLAINPFMEYIPEFLVKEFIEDYKRRMWQTVSNELKFPYTTITVYAHKP